ncbi:LON peptidase N-terminal domain and RING finger protein 3 [Chrysoperla carnea]|uniref:LON peptidase N-terminal domain and RING finger protein 3 n=1 Tax=Chrysoperla carnea TaxID=189513 RepID=UPI001D095A6E|nr:LON peptidase N-terminal domain and RING finger protein 3 [Chrysoperla carnea]
MWNQAIRDVLLCSICENILHTPITLECGHTFCRSCIDTNCIICSYPASTTSSTTNHHQTNLNRSDCCTQNNHHTQNSVNISNCRINVLIQGLVNRYRKELSGDNDELSLTAPPNTDNIKLRRRWSKAYRRRAKVHLEESIAAFCLATIYESQNRSFRQVVEKVLNNLLSAKRSLRARYSASGVFPCTRIDNRNHVPVASDSDEASSGDEDFMQGISNSTDLRKLVERIVRELECVRRIPPNNASRLISTVELDCVLCSRCLLEPVTTVCGHTFCRECLERVLDYGNSCPLCVTPISRADLSRGSTVVIERLLRLVIPAEYNERLRVRQQEIDSIDSQVPVFVCTTAFPGIACPLFVYEPRYRLLARRCLQSQNRRFAMAAPSVNPNEPFAKYGTMLEIKDAVRLQDGCTILTTIGVKRFRLIESGEKDGYHTASVQYIQDTPISNSQLPLLKQIHDQIYYKAKVWVNSLSLNIQSEVEHSFGAMPEPEFNWHRLPDGPTWTWWLMAILPFGLQLQVGILGTTNLEKRLRAIDKTLEHVIARMSAVDNNSSYCNNETRDMNFSCANTENNLQHRLENTASQQAQPINL